MTSQAVQWVGACLDSGIVSAAPKVGGDIRMDAALHSFFFSNAVPVFTGYQLKLRLVSQIRYFSASLIQMFKIC